MRYYCDTTHYRNPGVPTIENELFQALAKAQAIPDNLKVSPDKLWFDRCARTDRGVSAARQVVSLKISCLILPVPMNLFLLMYHT